MLQLHSKTADMRTLSVSITTKIVNVFAGVQKRTKADENVYYVVQPKLIKSLSHGLLF